jgi:hypothetical protein
LESQAFEAVVTGVTERARVLHPLSILAQFILLPLLSHTLFSCFDTTMVILLVQSVPSLKARYKSEFQFFIASVLVLDFERCRYL